ncbi:MAG: DUF3696 domain-containing protein [Bacteroidales bacterium]|nr:DUF3696 domain-containing protein [Bacteroidales bacterium]MBR4624489.1 DUF3696 domain-containing protein [Alphaproteobacteria bacterium]
MFNNIHLKGFKSFVDETIKLKPLTLLTGLNSSGKSSVIQAIRMIRNFRVNRTANIIGYGGFDELHNIFCRSELLIDLDGYQITSEYGSDDYKTNDDYDVDGDSFSTHWPCPLDSITYIGADRLGAKTNMPLQYGESTRGENVLFTLDWFSNNNLVLDERLKPENAEGLTLDYVVNGWLKYISPNVKFEYKVDRKADISYSRFNGFRATNVGFGLSYTLPIIVALLVSTTQKNSVVLIENPEAHLHPKGQTEMAKLIAKCVECGSQVIVETHSDHLFDGVRIYTKHNPGFNEKVVTHWFELDENNNTKVESIKFTPEGRITDECPKGFFDQFEINAEELLF